MSLTTLTFPRNANRLSEILGIDQLADHMPPSGWYRIRRFAARNRALVGGGVATFGALVASRFGVRSQRGTR